MKKKETKIKCNKYKTVTNMVDIQPAQSITTSNMNAVNTTIKSRLRKQDPTLWYQQETHLKYNDTYKLKAKGCRKLYDANTNQESWCNCINFRQSRLPGKKNFQK